MTQRETILAALAARIKTAGYPLHNRPISEPTESQSTAQLALVPQASNITYHAGGLWRHVVDVALLIQGPTTALVDTALEQMLVTLAGDLTLGGLLETPLTLGGIVDNIDLGRAAIYGRTLDLKLTYETTRWSA